jgi:asparagine synthase (glutamine-hydrolysing)
MLRDAQTYLPDDILVKLDRATMSVSLEARLPYLDAELVALSLALPTEALVGRRQGKVVLRRVLRDYLPPELVDRPKMGFALPLGRWLRGPLRVWAHEALAGSSLVAAGLLSRSTLDGIWQRHLSLGADNSQALWTVLMFECWLDNVGLSV